MSGRSTSRVMRLAMGAGISASGVMLLGMGIASFVVCLEPKACTQSNSEQMAAWLIGGFGLLLVGGRTAMMRRRGTGQVAVPPISERPRFCLLRQFSWTVLAIALVPVGLIAATMTGPGIFLISTDSLGDRSAIFMAFGGPPIALACYVGVRWIKRRVASLKLSGGRVS